MRKSPRLLFWFIIVLSIVAVLLVLPKTITLPNGATINGFNPNFFIGPLHITNNLEFKKGLDLDGGTSVTLQADMKDVPPAQRSDALESAKNVVERRVNLFGVSEPIVQTAKANDEYRILVELPGVTDVNQAVALIGKTAQLTFWEEGASGSAQIASPSALPLGMEQILGPNAQKTNLTGNDLQQVAVGFNQQNGQPQVQLVFTSEGAKKFADITTRNLNKPVVIVLDNDIISYPTVNQAITTGDAVISGGFTEQQANFLKTQLQAGALPVPLSVVAQQTIGPTLGEASLQKSMFAGVIGFIVIVIFMVALYGRLGVIASIALLLYAIYTLVIFKVASVTLTLAGIAGFILSIGMAVDANILIFERMKEELRKGKKKEIAMELGFLRAWSSIRDSNASTILTSLVLFIFGTGIVKGFAVTLGLGVLVSMFTAIIVTRTLLRIVYK